jgi:hypothetical protein
MKLGMYDTVHEPISTAYFQIPSHHSVCLYVYPSCRCGNEYARNNSRIFGLVVVYAVRVVSNKSR